MAPLLRVEGLQRSGLEPISFQLERCEGCSLSGPSGSGKTLFLRALADLDESRGLVELEGRSRASITAPRWRRQVGYLPAESGWWAPLVHEHFANWERVPLARLGLANEIGQAPVAQLSSGERQRLALLRLLENEPRVLLLDEPTSALDADSTRAVEELVAERRQAGACVLWVSHEKEQGARVATRHLTIDSGRVREVS